MITKLRYEAGNEDAWLKLRTSLSDKLGGSEVGTAANHNKYSSFLKMLAQEVGLIKKEDISDKMAVKLGHFCEEFVASEFERVSGKKVHKENCIFTNDEFPHLKASIDRKIANEDAGLECKFMSDMTMRTYKAGDFPEAYKDQCVTYLAVTGLRRWYLCIVTNSRLYCFLMTRDLAETSRYAALRAKFGFPQVGVDLENDPEYAEWKSNYAFINTMYYLDEEEMKAAEIVAAHFVDCKNQVLAYMKDYDAQVEAHLNAGGPLPTGWDTDAADPAILAARRKAHLTNAVYQVIDPADIDGSADEGHTPTADTLKEMFAHAIADSTKEIAPDSQEAKELTALLEERQQKAAQLKELAARLDEINNNLRLKIGETETMLLPAWKVTLKEQDGKRSCSVETVENYFTTKGTDVPEGMIRQGNSYRVLRVVAIKEKKPRKVKKEAAAA